MRAVLGRLVLIVAVGSTAQCADAAPLSIAAAGSAFFHAEGRILSLVSLPSGTTLIEQPPAELPPVQPKATGSGGIILSTEPEEFFSLTLGPLEAVQAAYAAVIQVSDFITINVQSGPRAGEGFTVGNTEK